MAKRYYWLKLPDNFFRQKSIKKLRRIAGGDTYTVIYLKMLLIAMQQNGRLYFEGVEDNFCEELALELDEETENVSVTVQFLVAQGLMELIDESEYVLKECEKLVGSESASAERVRRYRESKALQCNTDVTEVKRLCNVEKHTGNIEKEREKDIKENPLKGVKEKRFAPPTITEVQEYAAEKGYAIDAERFVDFYASKGWMIGKNGMKDWRAAVRNWTRRQDVATKGLMRQDVATKSNRFNNFPQRDYDYDQLEKQLLDC